MGLESLTFNYEGVRFEIGTAPITRTPDGRKIDPYPFILFPARVVFPSGQQSPREQFCFDGDKRIFLGMLVEDDEMIRYYPEEYAKSTKSEEDQLAYWKKWDQYRFEVSRVFEFLLQEGFFRQALEQVL